jgi:SAM-dependent methyltransferase
MKNNQQDKQLPTDAESIVEKVREQYGNIASKADSGCCGPAKTSCCGPEADPQSTRLGYSTEELRSLPEGTDLGLGCGAPVGYLDLKPGETVLDLGSGAGIDVLLAAGRVGPEGRAIGVDMTREMIGKATQNAIAAGVANVEFREGRLESLPVDDASVDAVTSNCVINLVPDKSAVFAEIARVLRPGGRMVISDIVLDGQLPEAIASDVVAYVGCVAGAEQKEDYFGMVREAGFSEVEILSDADAVSSILEVSPDTVANFAGRAGVSQESLKGIVRSVTYRATR